MLSYSLADVGKTITVVELDTVAGRILRQTSEYKGWHVLGLNLVGGS